MTQQRRRDAIGTTMVLRRVPRERRRLVEAMTRIPHDRGRGTWWEWVDPASPEDQPPTGLAITNLTSDGRSHISPLQISEDMDASALEDLLTALVAALRGTEANSVSIDYSQDIPESALRAAGFASHRHGRSSLYQLDF